MDDLNNVVQVKDFKKVQLLTSKSYKQIEEEGGFKFIAVNTLFKHICLDNIKEYDPKMPALNLMSVDLSFELIEKSILNEKNLYNLPEYKKISAQKQLFHKVLGNKWYLPKTVYNVDNAKKLKFPIIAKPSEGHSGIGITKFNKIEDLTKENNSSFDLYSEAINIDKEFRIIYIKDKVVALASRIPNDEKTKFLQGKSTSMKKQNKDSSLDFTYLYHDPNEIYSLFNSNIKDLNNIVDDIRKVIPLEYLAIDIVKDTNNKLFIIEINSTPGSPVNILSQVYKAIFEDFYKKEMDKTALKYFKEIELELLKLSMKNDKYEYSSEYINKFF